MRFAEQTIRSCIIAGAAGDALGGIAERGSKSFSDDTQLTLATCEAIMAAGVPEASVIADHMRAWSAAGDITGVGSSTLKALRDLEAGAHWALAGARGERAAGNGAAMRTAPLAFLLDPQEPGHPVRLRDIARRRANTRERVAGQGRTVAKRTLDAVVKEAVRNSGPLMIKCCD
jgi:ADP-ribosylglycohydrolase